MTSHDPSEAPSRSGGDRAPALRLFLIVTAVAAALRLAQWWFQQADPLFWNPLGGNLPYLLMGERIAAGEWLPMDGRPFSVSSPLYPWIAGLVFRVVGEADVGALRAAGAVVDALGCGLLALLAARRFGVRIGWATGLLAAAYAPLIHFSVELAPVPWTLTLTVGGLLLIDLGWPGAGIEGSGRSEPREWRIALLLAGGLLLGLAVGTRPNLLIGAALAPLVPLLTVRGGRARRRGVAAGAIALGLAGGIAPVTAANVAASGRFVLLTTGAGHNFYIGHNPLARPQYSLPLPLDGDIFESMKAMAETELGRPLDDTEVSGFYLRRALASMRDDPVREARLLYDRILSSHNDFEATTYSSFEYQEEWSPLLRVLPGFAVVFGLALVGVAIRRPRRDDLLIWIPWLAGFGTVVLFFYIARLRVLMVPSLLVWAGIGVVGLHSLVRRRQSRAVVLLAALGVTGWGFSSLPRFTPDPSNEWNKAGGLLRTRGFTEEAERFLMRGIEANPENPSSWRNLALVYEDTGRPAEAEEARTRADALEARARAEAEAYRALLESDGG